MGNFEGAPPSENGSEMLFQVIFGEMPLSDSSEQLKGLEAVGGKDTNDGLGLC